MDELFKDLEIMGITDFDDVELFVEESLKEEEDAARATKAAKEMISSQIVYQRKIRCALCGKESLTSSVRSGRIRFLDTDLDFRPIYDGFDPILYDVVVCPYCGYAALNKYFNRLSELKAKHVKQKITATYKGKEYPLILDYDMAIERYKLVLLNCALGHDSNGLKAYICLKISWLYRGKIQERTKNTKFEKLSAEEKLIWTETNAGLIEKEVLFIKNAYEGFKIAYDVEEFPIMGIDQGSMEYLIAEMARRIGDFQESKKWLSKVIQRQSSNKRLYNKIIEVRDLINKKSTT